MMTQFEFIKNKVLLLTPHWSSVAEGDGQFCIVGKTDDDRWMCKVLVPIEGGELRGKAKVGFRFEVLGKGFGLIKLGPGTWQIDGMVTKDGINTYVILCQVPEPAPWEETCQKTSIQENSCQSKTEESQELSKAV